MVIKSIEIKNKSNHNCDEMVYVYDFDIKLVKLFCENRELVLIFIILGTYLKMKMILIA